MDYGVLSAVANNRVIIYVGAVAVWPLIAAVFTTERTHGSSLIIVVKAN
jgi:hypothetical protein